MDAIRLNDLAERGPFGRSKLYEFVRSGELPARKRGGVTFVLEADWHQFLGETPLAVEARAQRGATLRSLGQGLDPGASGAREWLDRPARGWRPLENRDREMFLGSPDAKFLFRLGLGRHESRRLFGVELCFRSGEREFLTDVPGHSKLQFVAAYADQCLEECPALAADAKPSDAERDLGNWLRLSDVDAYLDGDGTLRVGEEIVALRSVGATHPWWREKIVTDHRLYRERHALALGDVNLVEPGEGLS